MQYVTLPLFFFRTSPSLALSRPLYHRTFLECVPPTPFLPSFYEEVVTSPEFSLRCLAFDQCLDRLTYLSLALILLFVVGKLLRPLADTVVGLFPNTPVHPLGVLVVRAFFIRTLRCTCISLPVCSTICFICSHLRSSLNPWQIPRFLSRFLPLFLGLPPSRCNRLDPLIPTKFDALLSSTVMRARGPLFSSLFLSSGSA